jgi:aarF domain-containing kinase
MLLRRTLIASGGVAVATAVASDSTDTSAARFARTLWHSANIAWDYKYGLATRLETGSLERKTALAATHQRSAERLLHVCRLHGGLYTKFGQFIASASYALPPQYPAVLAACQDRAPSVSFESVRAMLEEELGCAIADVFSEFALEPVAAASLAQVHRARTKDGQVVAVKVQYPQLARQVQADLWTIRLLATLVDLTFEGHSYGWLLSEFESNISAELNFRREAANAGSCLPCTPHMRMLIL